MGQCEQGNRAYVFCNLPSVKLLKSLGFELVDTEKVSFYKDDEGNDIIFDGGIFELNVEI